MVSRRAFVSDSWAFLLYLSLLIFHVTFNLRGIDISIFFVSRHSVRIDLRELGSVVEMLEILPRD